MFSTFLQPHEGKSTTSETTNQTENGEIFSGSTPSIQEPSGWSTLISQRDQSYTPQADDIEEIPWAVTEVQPTEEDDDILERSRTRQSFLSLAITKGLVIFFQT